MLLIRRVVLSREEVLPAINSQERTSRAAERLPLMFLMGQNGKNAHRLNRLNGFSRPKLPKMRQKTKIICIIQKKVVPLQRQR